MSANNQQLKQIKNYLQSQEKQRISQNGLKTEQSPKRNYWPWIWGGIRVVFLIGIMVYFLTKKEKNNG